MHHGRALITALRTITGSLAHWLACSRPQQVQGPAQLLLRRCVTVVAVLHDAGGAWPLRGSWGDGVGGGVAAALGGVCGALGGGDLRCRTSKGWVLGLSESKG